MEDCNPMEALYERRCSNFIYVVPNGLQELMTDISKEVLRCNPKQLCCFIADYLDCLLITRENARVACRIVDHVVEASLVIPQLLQRLDISKEKADRCARIIQRTFRKYMKKISHYFEFSEYIDEEKLTRKLLRQCRITIEEAVTAAQIIQRAYRSYRARLQAMDPCGSIDWRLAAQRTINIFRKITPPTWEVQRAATLIQTAYKGYYTRKLIKKMATRHKEPSELPRSLEEPSELPGSHEVHTWHSTEPETEACEIHTIDYDAIMHEVENEAAIIIQRAFRAYRDQKKKNWDVTFSGRSIIPDNIKVLYSTEKRRRRVSLQF